MKAAELTNPVIGPEFRGEWYGWPPDVELAFTIWAGTCVYGGLSAKYRADPIEAGASTAPRETPYSPLLDGRLSP